MSEILFYKTQCSVFLNNETCMFWHSLYLKSNDTRYKGQNLPFSHVYHKFNRPLNVAFLDIKVCFPLRRPHCPLETTSQQRHAWHHTPSDHCPSWGHLCTYQGRTQTVVENVQHLWCQAGLHLSTHPILCCHWLDNSAYVLYPRYHRGLLNIHWSSLYGRHCLASSISHGCYHITQELQWFCFTSRTQHLLAKDKTTEHWFRPWTTRYFSGR